MEDDAKFIQRNIRTKSVLRTLLRLSYNLFPAFLLLNRVIKTNETRKPSCR